MIPFLPLFLAACPPSKPVNTGAPPCDPAALPSGDMVIDPDGPLTQIHPWAAWDGEGIRLVWNRPDADGNFDVFTRRLAADGTLPEAAASLDDGLAGNHTCPRVAWNAGTALGTWQTDDQVSADNLDLYARPVGGDLVHLDPVVDGAPVTGNTWMPSITADPAGGFQVAASVVVGETFQVAVQAVDAMGNPVGDAVLPAPDPAVSQYNPSLSVGGDGSRVVAWEEWDAAGATYIRVARYAGAVTPDSVTREDDGSGLPSVTPDAIAFYDADYDIVLRVGDAEVVLGGPGETDHSPVVATQGDVGVVAWMRVISGIRNAVVVQDFTVSDGAITPGEPAVLQTDTDVAPYPLSLVSACNGGWFLVWVEGENPDYLVKGRFL